MYLVECIVLLAGWWGELAIKQNTIWKSDKTLWEQTIRVSPGAIKAYTNLGRIYFFEGYYDQAFSLFDKARHILFTDPHYDFFEGFLYFVRQDTANAIHSYNKALARDPEFIEALYQMGLLYEDLGNKKEAAAYFQKALLSSEGDVGRFKALAKEHLDNMSQH